MESENHNHHEGINQLDLQNETLAFLGLDQKGLSADDTANILKKTTAENPLVTNCLEMDDLASFHWDGNVLGELETNRSEAIKKGIRYRPFGEIAPYFFASSTLNVPDRKATLAALATAQFLAENVTAKKLETTEKLIAGTTKKSFELLCRHYALNQADTEAVFDDNATMALYQFLGLCDLKRGDSIVGFVDMGRVMPNALKGNNPEFVPANFQAAVDIWQNRASARAYVDSHDDNAGNLEELNLEIIDHFGENGEYESDAKLIDIIIALLKEKKPKIFVMPTVTRSGRRLPTQKICAEIRANQENVGYMPILIIDDAQGMARLQQKEYLHDPNGFAVADLLQHADAIFFTGAKALRALPGSSALLYKKSLTEKLDPFMDSKLRYRARRYGFYSTDASRVADYNNAAPALAQTPELASLNATLPDCADNAIYAHEKMTALNKKIIDELKTISGVQIVMADNVDSFCIPDIITFSFDRPEMTDRIKKMLSNPEDYPNQTNNPIITLPAIFMDSTGRSYLRISLDCSRVHEVKYEEKIDFLLKRLREVAVSE